MEDTFSKRKSGVFARGARPPDNEDTTVEDEDIDFLNDETFGGDVEEGDFDWEEEHEKYAEVIDHVKHGERMRDSGYGAIDKSYRSQEEYMEQSISQLVVDDDEVEDPAIVNSSRSYRIPKREQNLDELFGPASPPGFLDTEHLVSPTSKNIWGSPSKESHMPKPVNNLQSLFDFAKASSASIHRQHPSMSTPDYQRRSPRLIQKGHTVEELENQLLQKPTTISRPVTAEELERAMRGEVIEWSTPQLHRPTIPQYEQHIQHQRPPQMYNQFSPSPMSMMNGRRSPLSGIPGSTPPMIVHQRLVDGRNSPLADMMGITPPGMSGMVPQRLREGHNSPLTADMMGMTPPRQNNMSPIMMGNNRQSPLGMMGLTTGRRTTPSPPTYNMSPLIMQSPISQARLVSPYLRGQMMEMLANRAPTAPIGIPRQMGRGSMPPNNSPYNSPAQHQPGPYNRNSYNSPVHHHQSPSGPYQSPSGRFPNPHGLNSGSPAGFSTPQAHRIPHHHNNGNTDPRHTRGRGRGNYQNRGDRPLHPSYREREFRENRTFNNRRYYQYNPDTEHRRVDDYAGLMTQKEKDWIIKIQLLQLQTDNPYIDDYYYTTFAIKKKALERQRQIENGEIDGKNEPELVIPAMAKLETKAYKPAHFEGSLGRLTTSSVHNPRQIIDLQSHDIHEEGQGHCINKELRKARQLLMEIEKGYNLLLEVDDIEKKILALPEEARTPLFEQRHAMLYSLYKYVISDDFIHLMMVRKGRRLVARVIPNLDNKNAEDVVMLILKRLQILLKKDHPDEGLMVLHDPVVRTIQGCDLKSLVQFSSTLLTETDQNQTVTQALQNKFGSSVVCTLIHRGEILYNQMSPLDIDNQLQTEWCQFIHDLASVLTTVPLESLVRPKLPQATISGHFDRLLNKKQIASLEDKLKVIAEPQAVS